MAQMRMETDISAQVDKVYEFVANVENHPLYADYVERLEITSPHKRGLGVTFNQYIRRGNQVMAVASQIIELVPNRKVAWTAPHRDYLMPVTYLFQAIPSGTRVTHEVEAPWYSDPAEQARWREDNARELANLKRLLERT